MDDEVEEGEDRCPCFEAVDDEVAEMNDEIEGGGGQSRQGRS